MTIERFVPPLSRFDGFERFDALNKKHTFEKHSRKVDRILGHQKETIINQATGVMRVHNSPHSAKHIKANVFSPMFENESRNFGDAIKDAKKKLDIYNDGLETSSDEAFRGIKEPLAIVDKNSNKIKIDPQTQISHNHVANLFSRIDQFHNAGDINRTFRK